MSSHLTSLSDNVFTVTLNRPDIHNAFDDVLIADLTQTLREAEVNEKIRVIVLTGTGKSFSAGADLNWMKRMARYTAERFGAADAQRMGLLNEVVDADELDQAVARIVALLLAAGPGAQAEAKDLIAGVSHRPPTDSVIADTAERIAHVRVSPEGQEGLAAFLEKRKPYWVKE